MSNQTTKVLVAGVTVGDTALTFLVTAGELDPNAQGLVAIVLSLTVLVHAVTLLVWTSKGGAR
ncbi:hypothetical protein ACIG87_25440 [Micromonospora sp. NPDC051925]|uniref:hypothetical protein n=1 Tax=Micromonospora sp. NPDC051925 TaxID=3364288 RepID=UPI0037CC3E85